MDNEINLSDSSSILKYPRNKSGQEYLSDIVDFDNYCLVNTLMDSEINVYLLEKSGVESSTNDYLLRQKSRIQKGLEILNERFLSVSNPMSDSQLRCAVFLDWAAYRQRFDFEHYTNLMHLLSVAKQNSGFIATSPT